MSTTKATVARRKDPAVLVRFPKAILKKLGEASRQNGRSRNTEIILRLDQSFQTAGEGESATTAG